MRVHVLSAASILLAAAACGSQHETSAPDASPIASSIRVASSVPATVAFGQRITVSVLVSASDGSPSSDVTVSFSASDSGVVDPSIARTDARGIASAVWKISDVRDRQTFTAQSSDGKVVSVVVTATNAWSTITNTNPIFTARFADDTLPGTTTTWASTALGSPPQLVIACEHFNDPVGVVTLALTHPRLTPTRSTVTWTLDAREPVTEEWDAGKTGGLGYPWGDFSTRALVGWIEAGTVFTLRFHDAATNADYTARFGSGGLQRTALPILATCGLQGPWDPEPVSAVSR